MQKKPSFLFSAATCALCGFLISSPVLANNNDLTLSLSESAIWNSNPLMLTRNVTKIWGSETDLKVGIDKDIRTATFKTNLSIKRNQFNESEYNSTDFAGFTNLGWETKRIQLGLKGRINYDTTRTSEITNFNLDVGSVRRFAFSVTPSISYTISPRSVFSIDSTWYEVDYDSDNFSDYRTLSATPSLSYQLTPLQQVFISTLFNRYESLNAEDREVDTIGPSIGWQYNFNPNFYLMASGGMHRTKFKGYAGVREKWKTSPSFSTRISYKDEQHQASLSAERTRQSYGNGTESELTTFSARERYAINKRLAVNLGANYHIADQPSNFSSSALDNAWDTSAGLAYTINRNWDVRAGYNHREEKLKNAASSRDRDILRIGLSYKM